MRTTDFRVHLIPVDHRWPRVACGRERKRVDHTTTDRAEVTCGQCKRTLRYLNGWDGTEVQSD